MANGIKIDCEHLKPVRSTGMRGAMFGVYAFCEESLGVDPCCLFLVPSGDENG